MKGPLVQLLAHNRINTEFELWFSWVFQALLQISKERGIFSIVSKEKNGQNINFE